MRAHVIEHIGRGSDHSGRYSAGMSTKVLVVDNYDSFVYILVQYLGELGADPIVYRHDAITVDEVVELDPDRILISPGPGTPDESGISLDLITRFAGIRPIFGVCLGLQCIAPSVRRHRRAIKRSDARQDVVHRAPGCGRVRRARLPARSNAVSLARC